MLPDNHYKHEPNHTSMVLDKLGDGLRGALSKLTGAAFVDEKLINEIIKDFQRALLQSDVNVKLVFALTNKMKERAKEKAPPGLTKKEQLVNIIYEELTAFMGGENTEVDLKQKPTIIMLVGLFGNGKTTTAGKLAKYYTTRGKKVALVSTDTWRPAAFEQLKQLGAQVGVPVYGDPNAELPQEIWNHFRPQLDGMDIIICDTAGRDALSDELVEEIKTLDAAVNAHEKLLVVAADVGQSAQSQAQMFHDTTGVSGVVITKMDGTAKGGGALSACAVTGAPVKFIGVGEKIDALEQFKPKNFVGRLLGMGDIESLLEKAKLAMQGEDTEEISKKLLKGDFTLIDLHNQMAAMKKMGPLNKVIEMIPGMGGAIPKDALKAQEKSLEKWKYIMQSMTKEELEDGEKLSSSRIERISQGSGQSASEVKSMIKQYRQSKKMMKMLKGKASEKKMKKMMQRMGGAGGMPKF